MAESLFLKGSWAGSILARLKKPAGWRNPGRWRELKGGGPLAGSGACEGPSFRPLYGRGHRRRDVPTKGHRRRDVATGG